MRHASARLMSDPTGPPAILQTHIEETIGAIAALPAALGTGRDISLAHNVPS